MPQSHPRRSHTQAKPRTKRHTRYQPMLRMLVRPHGGRIDVSIVRRKPGVRYQEETLAWLGANPPLVEIVDACKRFGARLPVTFAKEI